MNLVLLSHPDFLNFRSISHYVKMLAEGMRQRGHNVEILSPKPKLYHLPFTSFIKKWFGYIDQFVVFPTELKKYLNLCSDDTLFIVTDNSLGPWVPFLKDKPHVIHCHDFLAQYSALGEIVENKTKWTGRQYQSYIRKGYNQGKNFISVSQKTRDDLSLFLYNKPHLSEVVYNGLHQQFSPNDPLTIRNLLSKKVQVNLNNGYILHVGGNQWYKNRTGVIEIYDYWRKSGGAEIPLLLVGEKPNKSLIRVYSNAVFRTNIYFVAGIDDSLINLAYAGATVLLFPSLAEGFGWPIAEAMASGCPVITTGERPMSEVAGDAAFFISRRLHKIADERWLIEGSNMLDKIVSLTEIERERISDAGLLNAKRFSTNAALDKIESIYMKIIQNHNS